MSLIFAKITTLSIPELHKLRYSYCAWYINMYIVTTSYLMYSQIIFQWITNSTSILLDLVTICIYLVSAYLMEADVLNLKLVSYGTLFLKN